jgi:hypothetical protein
MNMLSYPHLHCHLSMLATQHYFVLQWIMILQIDNDTYSWKF